MTKEDNIAGMIPSRHSHQASDKENIVPTTAKTRTKEQITALKDARDALPCYLGTRQLFTEVETKEGTSTMPAACAIGFLMQQTDIDCTEYEDNEEIEPRDEDWDVLEEKFGLTSIAIMNIMGENDTIAGDSYAAAHNRCLKLNHTLTEMIDSATP